MNEHGSSKAHTVISSNSQQWKLALTMRACTWTTFQVLPSTVFLSSFLSLILPVLSLHVVLGSSCTRVCTKYPLSSNTTIDEVTCHDSDYNTTSVGQTFKECISCELQSQTFDHGINQTDLGWALFNIRYTLTWCIFGIPGLDDHSSISPCSDTCRNISDAVEKNILNATASSTYDYCDELNSPADLSPCASCYSPIKTQLYLSNYLNLLRSACELNILTPTPFPITGSQIFTSNPPNNYSSSQNSTSNGLSYGARLVIGMAISATLLLLVTLAILAWYIRDYKRKRSSISDQILRFPSPPTKPLPRYKPFPPLPPIMKQKKPSRYNPPGPPPNILHETPRLRNLSPSNPAPKPLQHRRPWPHIATQFIFTHPIHHQSTTPTTRATNMTTGPPLSPFSSPPPRSAMRGSSRITPRPRGAVKFELGGVGR